MEQYDEEDFGVLPVAVWNNNPVAMRSYDFRECWVLGATPYLPMVKI